MFNRVNKRLKRERDEAVRQAEQMGAQLENHQRTIEVMGEALTEKDTASAEFVGRLHETMGGAQALTCEGDALARLRVLRAHADQYIAIRDVLAGRFDPSVAVLKRVACAVGCAQFDVETVVERAGQIAQANTASKRELATAMGRVDELEGELNDDCPEWRDPKHY